MDTGSSPVDISFNAKGTVAGNFREVLYQQTG